MKILIVDDSPIDMTLLESWVNELPGEKAIGFNHPEEALNWSLNNEADLVVVDYMMPDVNGLDFIRRFRKISGCDTIPIVMVTVEPDKSIKYFALEQGALDFLNKPLDKTEFLVRIKNMLELRSSQVQLSLKIKELRLALDKVKQLSGFLPICAACKKIRNDQGYWEQIEAYIRDHSEAEFSHGICPDCFHKLYPEIEQDRE